MAELPPAGRELLERIQALGFSRLGSEIGHERLDAFE